MCVCVFPAAICAVDTSPLTTNRVLSCISQSQIKIKSNYFIVRLKVDQRAGQLSLPHTVGRK